MSRYADFTLNNGEYIPQYAGSALDVINDTNTELQNRHYSNIANASNLEILAQQMKSQAPEGARPYFDQHINAIKSSLEEMAANGGENSTARVNALARTLKGDQGILLAQKQAAKLAELEKNIQQIKTNKGNPLYDSKKAEDLRKAPVIINIDGKEVLNPLYTQDFDPSVEHEIDRVQDYKRIVDEIQPDLNQKFAGYTQLKDGKLVFTEKAVQELDQDKLNKMESLIRNAYRKTESYRQGLQYRGEDDKQATDAIVDFAGLKKFKEDHVKVQPLGKGGGSGSGDDSDKPVLFDYNTSQATPIKQEGLDQFKQNKAELSTLLTNLKKQPVEKDPIIEKDRQYQIKAVERQLREQDQRQNAVLKKVDNTFKFDQFYKEYEDAANSSYKNPEFFPKTKEEFVNFIKNKDQIKNERLGFVDPSSKTELSPQAKALNKAINSYENATKKVIDKLHYATNYQIVNTTDKAETALRSELISSNFDKTSWTDPVTDTQVTMQELQKEFGDDYTIDPKATKVDFTNAKFIDGKPVFHLSIFGKKKGEKDGVLEKIGEKTITPQNNQKAIDHFRASAYEQATKGRDQSDRQQGIQMMANADFIPVLHQSGYTLNNISTPTRLTGIMDNVVVDPIYDNQGNIHHYNVTDGSNKFYAIQTDEDLALLLSQLNASKK